MYSATDTGSFRASHYGRANVLCHCHLPGHMLGCLEAVNLQILTLKQPKLAGVLVLEELEHAQARGAPILAEFLGGSCTCDAHHMTEPQPQGRGVRLCIEKCAPVLALKWARIRFEGQLFSHKGASIPGVKIGSS